MGYSLAVVQEIVSHVIANVAEHAATVYRQGRIPVVGKDSMGQFPERCSQDNEEGRGHHKSVFVHGQIMMDSVQQEMQSKSNSIIGKEPGHVSQKQGSEKLKISYRSMWNRNRCMTYSIKVQRKTPKTQ